MLNESCREKIQASFPLLTLMCVRPFSPLPIYISAQMTESPAAEETPYTKLSLFYLICIDRTPLESISSMRSTQSPQHILDLIDSALNGVPTGRRPGAKDGRIAEFLAGVLEPLAVLGRQRQRVLSLMDGGGSRR